MPHNDQLLSKKSEISPRYPFGSDFQDILSLIGDAVISIDENGLIIMYNLAAEGLFGYSAEEVLGRPIDALIPVRFQDQHREHHGRFFTANIATSRTMAAGREVQGRRNDGIEFAIEVSLSRQLIDGNQVGTAVIRDVSIRIGQEKQRLLIANEVAHRLRNTMAVINSIVALTAKGSSSVAEFQNALLGRFAAISRTHESLIRSSWTEAKLCDLIETELAPYQNIDRKITIDGPDLAIDREIAVSLALAFHELATNASKYGALSTPTGQLHIHWMVTGTETRILELNWQEAGGPMVVPPTKLGFGSELISISLSGHGGTAKLTYPPAGVNCAFILPLA